MRICFIGDSFVQGTGDPDMLGWPGRICATAARRGHDMTCYNLGVRGNTSTDILKRWRAEAEARTVAGQDTRLVFSFGVNDTKDDEAGKRIIDGAQSVAQARGILTAARTWQPTLMIGPAPVADQARNARAAELCRTFAGLCKELDVSYLAVLGDLRDSSPWMDEAQSNDGVHPRAGGYNAFATLVESWNAWRAWAP